MIDRSDASSFSTGPLTTISPPCSPAPGPMSTTQSACADRVLVVLDNDQSVTQVAKPDEGVDEAPVVPLVQPDARLVQHVQDADQTRPDLGGQPDALRLAAGERPGTAVERQVVQADVEQEARRASISLTTRRRSGARARSSRPRPGSGAHSPIDIAATSAIERPPTVTASDSGLSRAPLQVGHATSRM